MGEWSSRNEILRALNTTRASADPELGWPDDLSEATRQAHCSLCGSFNSEGLQLHHRVLLQCVIVVLKALQFGSAWHVYSSDWRGGMSPGWLLGRLQETGLGLWLLTGVVAELHFVLWPWRTQRGLVMDRQRTIGRKQFKASISYTCNCSHKSSLSYLTN